MSADPSTREKKKSGLILVVLCPSEQHYPLVVEVLSEAIDESLKFSDSIIKVPCRSLEPFRVLKFEKSKLRLEKSLKF